MGLPENYGYLGATIEAGTFPQSGGPTPTQPPDGPRVQEGSKVMGWLETAWAAISTLGGLLKGKTKHASYNDVNPLAQQFEAVVYKDIVDTYGVASTVKIAPFLASRFTDYTARWWGTGAALNKSIVDDIAAHSTDLVRLLWLFDIWVLTNQDQDSGEDTKRTLFSGLFNEVVISSIAAAGYDTAKILDKPGISIVVPPPPPPPPGEVNQAGIGLAAILLVGLFFAFGKH